jgi:hypothetical protein
MATSIALVSSAVGLGALVQRAARLHLVQLRALTSTIESAGDKLSSRVGRIADRTERVEKALLELVQRADAAMSIQGIDVKAYRETMRESAMDRMRELLARGEESAAINLWRETTGIGLREALAVVENLEREMSRAGASS